MLITCGKCGCAYEGPNHPCSDCDPRTKISTKDEIYLEACSVLAKMSKCPRPKGLSRLCVWIRRVE